MVSPAGVEPAEHPAANHNRTNTYKQSKKQIQYNNEKNLYCHMCRGVVAPPWVRGIAYEKTRWPALLPPRNGVHVIPVYSLSW